MNGTIRVLLVDDEPLVRRGLRAILESDPEIEVVGEAGDGAAALASARSLSPDVVCMDVRMPDVDGIRATELVLTLDPAPRVLVVTTFESDDHVFDALRAGASGFLLKRADADQVVAAVRAVAAGESLLFPESVRRIALRHGTARISYGGPALTPREAEVLALVARGMSNPEIATALVVGVETVRTHVANVLAKLGARDRTQAVVIAYETGLVAAGR
ncbi:response regulator transcription factor [Mumia sp. ZJ1417]|uniref:response regulator transcription factor n=1 Tax=unclassified Mumia TaxID=2621872 RepID=UPI001420DEB7|nr:MULTISPECIES: response regulator transcription factor [unclassified Mumia]QMW66341.1 response regulator transcription factor [Mumia sp. ZJ1417]